MMVTEQSRLQQQLGCRIRELRQEKGLSQDALAHLTGMSRSYPSLIEQGSVDIRVSMLVRIADALGTTSSDLLAAAEEKGE